MKNIIFLLVCMGCMLGMNNKVMAQKHYKTSTTCGFSCGAPLKLNSLEVAEGNALKTQAEQIAFLQKKGADIRPCNNWFLTVGASASTVTTIYGTVGLLKTTHHWVFEGNVGYGQLGLLDQTSGSLMTELAVSKFVVRRAWGGVYAGGSFGYNSGDFSGCTVNGTSWRTDASYMHYGAKLGAMLWCGRRVSLFVDGGVNFNDITLPQTTRDGQAVNMTAEKISYGCSIKLAFRLGK